MRDPRTGARAHDWLERRHDAARGPPDIDGRTAPHVDVRLPIRYDDHFLAPQLAMQNLPQRVRCPGELRIIARAMIGFEVLDQRAKIPRNRPQLGGWAAEAA